MGRAVSRAGILAGGTLAIAMAAGAEAGAPEKSADIGVDRGAWAACDRLDVEHGFPAAGGLWFETGLRSWEALPEAVEARLGAGIEPRRGAGVRAVWSTLTIGEGETLRDAEIGGVLRVGGGRVEVDLADTRFAGRSLRRARARALVVLDRHWIAGATVDVIPEATNWAPEVVPEVRGRGGPWLLAATIHEHLELAVGLEPRPGFTALVRYQGGAPTAGVVLCLGALQFQAEASDHPYLGRTAKVRLRWGGAR